MQTFKINGTDLTPYIAQDGMHWSISNVDGGNGGLMLDGSTTIDRIAQKVTLAVDFIAQDEATISDIIELLMPVYITVTYSDPVLGNRSMTAFCESIPASVLVRHPDGLTYWHGLSVTIKER